MSEEAPARVLMARVGAPHGVRGAVRLAVFAEDPLGLRRYNPFETADGRRLKLRRIKAVGKSLVAEFEGIGERSGAEAIRDAELFVPRQRLPRPQEDEFYHVDLIGLEALTPAGERLGVVRAVNDYGAGDILEIAGAQSLLVPFTREVVPEVDLEGGRLIVDPPPGLLDDDDEEGEDARASGGEGQ